MPILPRIKNGCLILPVRTIVLCYGTYALVALAFLGIRVELMTTMIPDESLIATVVTLVLTCLAMYVVFYIMAYKERRTKINTLKKVAIEKGVPVDALKLDDIESFHTTYMMSMFIGTALSAAIAFFVMITVIPGNFSLTCTEDYIMYAFGTAIGVSFVMDYIFCHRVADGTFKDTVETPLVEALVGAFQKRKDVGDEETQAFYDFIKNL